MTWVNSAVLDNGLNEIKNNCNKLILIGAYAAGDTYATVMSNLLAEVAMAPADFTLANSGTVSGARELTTAQKQDTAANTSGGGTDNLFAFVDTIGQRVLWVPDETTNQAITAGNPVTFPSMMYRSKQPTTII